MRPWLLFLGSLGALATAHLCKLQVTRAQEVSRRGPPIVVPSPTVARLLTLGQDMLAADIYWLKTLQYFGDQRYRRERFPGLVPLIDLVLALDPEHCLVYRTAGLILTSSESYEVPEANRLLLQGMQRCRDDWYIPFVLGFNQYFFQNDLGEAGRLLTLASQRPSAPEWLGDLAVRLLAQVNELAAVEDMLLGMLEGPNDEAMTAQLERRLKRVRTERLLRKLDHASVKYRERNGRVPLLEELVEAGLAPRGLVDPSGGELSIDPSGKAQSSAYGDRLELKPKSTESSGGGK